MIRDHLFTESGTYQFPYVSQRYGLFQPQTALPYSHAHDFLNDYRRARVAGFAAILLGAALLPKVLREASSIRRK